MSQTSPKRAADDVLVAREPKAPRAASPAADAPPVKVLLVLSWCPVDDFECVGVLPVVVNAHTGPDATALERACHGLASRRVRSALVFIGEDADDLVYVKDADLRTVVQAFTFGAADDQDTWDEDMAALQPYSTVRELPDGYAFLVGPAAQFKASAAKESNYGAFVLDEAHADATAVHINLMMPGC